jgi:hypothetical protein
MSESPQWLTDYLDAFGREKLIQGAFTKVPSSRTPTLAMVHVAYVNDDIDYVDLERLIDAALRGEPTEIPEPMLSRFWPPNWTDAMKEMWTSPQVLIPAVPTTDEPGSVMYYRGSPPTWLSRSSWGL